MAPRHEQNTLYGEIDRLALILPPFPVNLCRRRLSARASETSRASSLPRSCELRRARSRGSLRRSRLLGRRLLMGICQLIIPNSSSRKVSGER